MLLWSWTDWHPPSVHPTNNTNPKKAGKPLLYKMRWNKPMNILDKLATSTAEMWNSSEGATEWRWYKGRGIRWGMSCQYCLSSSRENPTKRVQMGVMDCQQWQIDEVQQSWHKQIPKTTEMCAIPNIFSKYVSRIDLARDVLNIDGFISHPFPNRIFPELMWLASLEVMLYDHLTQALLSF